ncbi:MAG: hypothetical protein JRN54_07470 [Nitrososphaerota archaeon]|jgi:hypothetical protein|nr:hypothetical protein [Nitrososphaerota archaeon]
MSGDCPMGSLHEVTETDEQEVVVQEVLQSGGDCEASASADRAPTHLMGHDQKSTVDLRQLKRAARALPETDPIRQLIEGEPDSLPLRVLAAKADSWVLLLLQRRD